MALIELFDRPINNNPDDTKRLALGDPNSAIEDIELGDFYTLLAAKLGLDDYALESALTNLATKTYAMQGLASGSTTIGDIDNTGNKEDSIVFSSELPNTNYRVLCEIYDPTGQPSYIIIKAKYTTGFTYHIVAAFNSGTQNITLNWKVEPL